MRKRRLCFSLVVEDKAGEFQVAGVI
jgi:hypothetical protein